MSDYKITHDFIESLLVNYVEKLSSVFSDAGFNVETKQIPPQNMLGKQDTKPYQMNITFNYLTQDEKPEIREGELIYWLIHNCDDSYNPGIEKILLDTGGNKTHIKIDSTYSRHTIPVPFFSWKNDEPQKPNTPIYPNHIDPLLKIQKIHDSFIKKYFTDESYEEKRFKQFDSESLKLLLQ